MSDQLDMFGSPEPRTTPVTSEEIGTLIDQESQRPEKELRPMIVSPAVADVMARFLAGMVYRDAKKYEALPAHQRQTAERAAQAALDVFAKEENDG